ncbi:MAG: type II secretion system F family protein [bacterium]
MVWLVYMLVFGAVVLVIYSFAGLANSISMEKVELDRKSKEIQSWNNPMNRFISDQRLVQFRVSSAVMLGGVFTGILLFASVTNPLIWIPIAAGMGFVGWMSPFWYYNWKLTDRKNKFENRILDLTMGLANGLRSGQALPQALEAIARRLEGPIQEELMVVLREYRFGLELAEALERMHQRMPCEDLRLLVTSVRLTSQSGGSMAEVLSRMTEMIRGRTEFQGKLRTLTAQGRFEAIAISASPLVAFVILYLVDTELMAPMLKTTVGWMALGVVVLLETIGFYIINKIVTIEV